MRVRTTYLGATETVGSRIRVFWEGKQYTESYDYSAIDPHLSAVAHALNVPESHVKPVSSTKKGQVWETPGPLPREPRFKPDDVPDYYRWQWSSLTYTRSQHTPDDASACKLQISGDANESTKWLNISLVQARHILAYLSETITD